MDKEKLAKHHFWILLVIALILLPVIMAGVWMGVASATEKKRSDIDSRQKALNSSQPKGANLVQGLEAQKSELEIRKIKDWEKVYQAQRGLIEWPAQLKHLDNRYFGDPLPDPDRNTFRKGEVYTPEYEALADLIKPTELAGGWQDVLQPVKWGEKRESDEDVWLALENLCIQREMLRCIHSVNQLLARFRDATVVDEALFKDEPDKAAKIAAKKAEVKTKVEQELKESLKPAEGETVQRFVSPYFQLDLGISRASQGREFMVRGKLKNISHRRLNIARIDFLLTLNDPAAGPSRPAVLTVEGDYLAVGGEINIKPRPLTVPAPKPFVYAVEQKLDSRYVPVKRLDKVKLGYHSHRTVDKPNVMCKMSEEAKKATAPEGAPADPNAPASAAAGPAPEKSNSGIDRLRYVTCTEQVRRMPIGFVVTVDQAHIQDVLRAMANSRLRFQTTQIHLTHASTQGGSSSGGGIMPSTVGPTPSMMGEMRPGGPARPGTPALPVMPSAPAMTTAPSAGGGGSEEANANLVEMGVYGLASIYEKFPPKGYKPPQPTITDGGQQQPPTEPAAPTPPNPAPPGEAPKPPSQP